MRHGPVFARTRVVLDPAGTGRFASAAWSGADRSASQRRQGLLGPSGVVAVSVPLPDSFLVVGVPAAASDGMDFSALLLRRPLRHADVHAVHAVFPDEMADYKGFQE